MEELSQEQVDKLLEAPKRSRKKKLERTYRAWFYDIETSLGNCDNPDCPDTRKKSMCFVWEHPSGQHMCRFCFVDEEWLADEQ